jgi:A-kinase anchor protein 13
MRREVNLSADMVSRIFPKLNELLDIHRTFLQTLIDLQTEKPDKSIECIGETLLNQVTSIQRYNVLSSCG